jgi:hypothetical protein
MPWQEVSTMHIDIPKPATPTVPGLKRKPLSSALWASSAPHPGPRQRRGRSKARAPMARKPCLLAPRAGEKGQCPGEATPGFAWLTRAMT